MTFIFVNNMIGKYLKISGILLCIVFFTEQCTSFDKEKQDFSPTIRLEQELYKIPEGETAQGIQQLKKKYPDLMKFYLQAVLEIADTSQSQDYTTKIMDDFIHHPQMVSLNDTVQLLMKDFGKYEKELHGMLSKYHHYFPNKPMPQLVTFTSQFGPKSFYFEPYLGVGLDLYLGHNFIYYPSVGLPGFIIRRLEPQYISTDAAFNLIQDMKEEPLKRGAKLLDMMVYYGKIYYISNQLLPKREIRDFFYYTPQEWKWCEDNEKEIWSFFIDGEWLYNSLYVNYSKFINDGPTTMGMPQGAPDRVGRWVGYQIVKRYMDKHSNTSLEDLMKIESGQEFLNASKYKP
ncbi:MAG: hypothetical protein M9958_02255 [Chitinophagales bacterium]|nr:hypothetical protein [Chitinophagales bacterium]